MFFVRRRGLRCGGLFRQKQPKELRELLESKLPASDSELLDKADPDASEDINYLALFVEGLVWRIVCSATSHHVHNSFYRRGFNIWGDSSSNGQAGLTRAIAPE